MNNLLDTPENTIDLWLCFPLRITDADLLNQYDQLLSKNERIKQQRYKFAKHRHDALITRAFVRDLLSQYETCDAKDLTFKKGAKDKPYLDYPKTNLTFNLSHTDGLIICAVTKNVDIGADVENVKRDNAILDIADRYFSEEEVSALNTLPKDQQISRFFDYWTLKESFIKAVGLGLSIPLGDFSFDIKETTEKTVNDNIDLSTKASLNENPAQFKSWLFYPSDTHRIAVSIRADAPLKKQKFSFRFFESIPQVHTRRIDLMTKNLSD